MSDGGVVGFPGLAGVENAHVVYRIVPFLLNHARDVMVNLC